MVFVGWTGIVLSSGCTSEVFVASEESLLVEEKYCVLAFYLTRSCHRKSIQRATKL